MRKLFAALTLVIALVLAPTASAGTTNTGWPCGPAYGSYYGQSTPAGGGAYYLCYGGTRTWWLTTP